MSQGQYAFLSILPFVMFTYTRILLSLSLSLCLPLFCLVLDINVDHFIRYWNRCQIYSFRLLSVKLIPTQLTITISFSPSHSFFFLFQQYLRSAGRNGGRTMASRVSVFRLLIIHNKTYLCSVLHTKPKTPFAPLLTAVCVLSVCVCVPDTVFYPWLCDGSRSLPEPFKCSACDCFLTINFNNE